MFFEASVLWNFRTRGTYWVPGQHKIMVPASYQRHIMEKLYSSAEGLPSVAAPKVGMQSPKSAQHLSRLRVFISSSRGDQTTRNCTVRAELSRAIDRAISQVTSQQEGPPWENPCWPSALRRPTGSSLTGEHRTWARTADVLAENYFSALVAWWIAFLHWKEF